MTNCPESMFSLLQKNPYPGRGILVGHSPKGRLVLAYFIMGRSANSRNRIFVQKGDSFAIQAFDQSLVADPSLIFYQPLRQVGHQLVLSNGDQTDTIADYLAAGKNFEAALRSRAHEPDAPHFTPRISALASLEPGEHYQLSILRAANVAGLRSDRLFFDYAALPGLGRFIHTYMGDGQPLPSFCGEPRQVSIPEDGQIFAGQLWQALNPDNRVALFVRYIDEQGSSLHIFNRHQQGGQHA